MNNNNRTLKVVIIIAISIAGYFILQQLCSKVIQSSLISLIPNKELVYFLTLLILGIPLFIGVLILNKVNSFFESLGLDKSITKAVIFSLICTSPMLIGYYLIFDFNSEITWNKIFVGAITAAFIEELYFRGILFGQIYRFTNIGFIPSIIFGALIFASLHLYQSQHLLTLVGIFTATFLGSILFAWVYIEWENNLWVPIFLHLFMNLFWMVFSAGENAFGGLGANIFRILTILLIIILTILYKKMNNKKPDINRKTIWIKKQLANKDQ